MDDWSLSVAVEDKFMVFRVCKPDGMLPEGDTLYHLGQSFRYLKDIFVPILDVSGICWPTSDEMEFIRQWSSGAFGAKADLVADRDDPYVHSTWPNYLPKPFPIERRGWSYHRVTLSPFMNSDHVPIYGLNEDLQAAYDEANQECFTEDEWSALQNTETRDRMTSFVKFGDAGLPSPFTRFDHGYDELCARFAAGDSLPHTDNSDDEQAVSGSRFLRAVGRRLGRSSLLTQLALLPQRDGILTVRPWHADALYNTQTTALGDAVVVARPAVLAARTEAIFINEFKEFNRLVGDPTAREADFQRFFERHPQFIRMIGYKAVYPRVVLTRDDGTSLQPDFMLEPFDREFWDVLDIKLPRQKLVVGRRDRKDLSHQVHELIAQLREYSSYFDDPKLRRSIYDKYGIRAYKPRIVGIIGNDYDIDDRDQIQRVLTQYKDCKIVTYDQLRQIARKRLLI